MVKLRLRRIGKKKQPIYKIVAADSQAARAGKFLEAVGTYNPRLNPMLIEVKEERVLYWLKRGAQPSDTVRSLLQRTGFWLRWGLMRRGADESTIANRFEQWQMMQEEKHKREAEKKARRKAARKAKPARHSESAEPAAPKQEAATGESAKPAEEKPAEATKA